MSETPTECPRCAISLLGAPIPEELRQYYSGKRHYSRAISIYSRDQDAHDHWKCPYCGNEWK